MTFEKCEQKEHSEEGRKAMHDMSRNHGVAFGKCAQKERERKGACRAKSPARESDGRKSIATETDRKQLIKYFGHNHASLYLLVQ